MITKKVFNNLAIYMIGFGVMIGIISPFLIFMAGVPNYEVLTPIFFILCICAGFTVGLINIFLAKKIVGEKIKHLSLHMKYVENCLLNKTSNQGVDEYINKKCFISIDSDDEIGESAHAFNELVKSLSNTIKSETAIRTFTETLSNHLVLDKLGDEALNSLMKNLNAEGGAIFIQKEERLSILSSFGIIMPEIILKNEIIWKAIKEQKELITDFPEDILLSSLLVKFTPRTIMVEPISYNDTILGVVILVGSNSFANEMRKNMGLFRHGLSLAFRNAITHDQLQTLAANDSLTGIYNRRFGLKRLKEELNKAMRYKFSNGILIFDIDQFKSINDTYGHSVGDKVLVILTQTVKLVLREEDVFFRYGGDEFVITLHDASLTDVVLISERLRHLVENIEIQHNSTIIKFTISIGGTSYPESGATDMSTLINIVDKKLYQAKQRGKNISIID